MSDFNSMDEWQTLSEYLEELNRRSYGNDYTFLSVLEALNISPLELAEYYAEENGLIENAEELGEMFDRDILPSVVEQYGKDDYPAIREAFNNWTDGLCRDGQLAESQYQEYTYQGYEARAAFD